MRYPVVAWSRLLKRLSARGLIAVLGAVALLAGCEAGKGGLKILPAELGPNGITLYYKYLEAEGEKAFAYSSGEWYQYAYGRRYLDIAVWDAVEQCELKAGDSCELFAVGNTLVSQMEPEERAKILKMLEKNSSP